MLWHRKLLTVFVLLLFSCSFYAQNNDSTFYDKRKDNKPPGEEDEIRTFTGNHKKKFDWNKIQIEPNFTFSYDGRQLELGLSPYVGYNVWKKMYVGGGLTYLYYQISNYSFNGSPYFTYKDQVYGGGAYVQYNVWNAFFARIKFEVLNRRLPVNVNYNTQGGISSVDYTNKAFPGLFVGGGYNLARSKNFFIPIAFYYNLLYNAINKDYSPYARPFVVQIGFVNVF